MHHSHFNSIHSTQIYLKDNLIELQKHSPEILISAAEQTVGVGRNGSQWDMYANSIAMSFTLAPNPVPTLTPIEIGLLTALFLEKEFGMTIRLKWPNDLFTIHGKKCGGIIAQYIDTKTVIAGLGINLGSTEHRSAPEHYKHGLDSVVPDFRLSEDAQMNLSKKIYTYILEHRINEIEEIIGLFQRYCVHINRIVELDDEDEKFQGAFLGIGKNGEAIIEINGAARSFLSSSLKILDKN
jgi:BirA family biotin operon repressor/biotin-[acetyl-CoA-carboxylase] ligase